MQARFLLGPAGSGKTFRCLAGVREVLRRSPEGLPLLFLAPKQATFQLERQLLAEPALAGYTRLQILSFERLAEFILAELRPGLPGLLSEEGRTMVLRALLTQKRQELSLFHASARLPGFARQLSLLLRELQRHQISPARLDGLSAQLENNKALAAKLSDTALLFGAYREWLRAHDLFDADCLLDLATEALRCAYTTSDSPIRLAGLWLDGFAEMTPQELALLAAVVPLCEEATLAFCLESELGADGSWLSPWATVGQSFRRCHERLRHLPGVELHVEVLERQPGLSRFSCSPVLARLEKCWAKPFTSAWVTSGAYSLGTAEWTGSAGGTAAVGRAVRVVRCASPTAEARVAAREILGHVRAGGRYRDCAVLLRSLETYHEALSRVFRGYEIPFFLDRREPVAHHPLAELTRNALRTVTYHWQSEDWFGALKSGLVPGIAEDEIDRMENEALARGWEGDVWLGPIRIPDNAGLATRYEGLRRQLVPPFERLSRRLGPGQRQGLDQPQPTGRDLAAAIRDFWEELRVSESLERWSRAGVGSSRARPWLEGANPIHLTVWQQMNEWLGNVELAFPVERLSLRDWLPVLEAGLGSLTAGVVPPALDQVLIGAVDRSRNPELQLVLLLGLNEGVFPAKPMSAPLLSDGDREVLVAQGITVGPDLRQQLARERYYGYVAVTRARQRLVVTYSAHDADNQPLNPSSFLLHLRRLFPELAIEQDTDPSAFGSIEHACELAGPMLRSCVSGLARRRGRWTSLPLGSAWLEWLARFGERESASRAEGLSPALAELLYGRTLRASVTRLEHFAACPFRFFVSAGLLAEERQRFVVDVREQGSFMHAVLARFHEEVQSEGRRWRDLTPQEARERVARIAAGLMPAFRGGLFGADRQALFMAAGLTAALQDFVETSIAWMQHHYGFDPHSVELAFGTGENGLSAWELELGEGHRLALRGQIDRVDLAVHPRSRQAWCVVVDYKSGMKKVDPVLQAHGIQIQLPAYLAAICHLPDAPRFFGVEVLAPAGFFYVGLRGRYEMGQTRVEVLSAAEKTRQSAYRHRGCFTMAALSDLDRLFLRGQSGQFMYKVTKDGRPDRKYRDLLEAGEFQALLERVQSQLVAAGRRIFAGEVKVDPYRRGGKEVACNACAYRAICRIDPWLHQYRVLAGLHGSAGTFHPTGSGI
jgi:ATP-dependent helicase/nuclease subunit B